MSNIHTIDDMKKPNDQQRIAEAQRQYMQGRHPANNDDNRNNNPNEFRGVGRRLDGTTIEPPKEEKHQKKPSAAPMPMLDPDQPVTSNPFAAGSPTELDINYWSWNLNSYDDFNCKNICLLNYCPCCVGPCCSPARKSDWCGLLKRFTFWLMLLQLALYISTLAYSTDLGWQLEPDTDVVIRFGALSTEKIRYKNQVWRFITYMFLHGSWLHILFNSFAQFLFCIGCEKSWGYIRYISLYFLTGIFGGFFSAMRSRYQISVGASAGIFGIMGAFAALIVIYWSQLHEVSKMSLGSYLVMLPIMFICVSFLPDVDWAGHLGGVLAGIGLSFLIFCTRAEEKYRKWFIIIGCILVVICIVVPLSIIYTRS